MGCLPAVNPSSLLSQCPEVVWVVWPCGGSGQIVSLLSVCTPQWPTLPLFLSLHVHTRMYVLRSQRFCCTGKGSECWVESLHTLLVILCSANWVFHRKASTRRLMVSRSDSMHFFRWLLRVTPPATTMPSILSPHVPYELFRESLALTRFQFRVVSWSWWNVFNFTFTLRGSILWNTCTNISAKACCSGHLPPTIFGQLHLHRRQGIKGNERE